jgi:serine/threonine-protein kinase
MDQLLAALTRGRTQAQRRFTGIAVGVAATLMFLGAWRLSGARRVDCKPPRDRLAAAWSPGDPSDKRRQLLHAAVLASGHPEAAAIWGKLSSALDAYVGRWNAMYTETCEATHVRGEQSGEVLDLRMRCLNENLDEVRALTDVLATTDRATLPRGLTAVSGLTPVDRCADVRVLRAAVPLPRDEKTLRAVLALQSSIKEIQAAHDVGRYRAARDQAIMLRPKVETTQYKPLLAELLDLTGMTEALTSKPGESEKTLRMSFVLAIGVGDDLVAAKSATTLIYVTGYLEGRFDQSDLWWGVANAFLDRVGKGHERLRAWALQNQGQVFMRMGNYEKARDSFRHAVALKEATLGQDDPDVAVSLTSLGDALHELGHLQEALETLNRAAAILLWNSDLLDLLLGDRGEILLELGRYREAEVAEEHVLKDWETDHDAVKWQIAYPLTTLGKIRLATGDSTSAVSYLERALGIREQYDSDATLVAETRFGLARALWERGGDLRRALSLARSARETYATNNRPRKLSEVDAWLAAHAKSPRRGSGQGQARKQASRAPPSSAMVPAGSSARR